MKFQKTELFSKKTQFLFFQQGKNWGFFLNFSEFDFYLKNPLIEPWLSAMFSASSIFQNSNFFPEFLRIRFLFKKSADRAVAFLRCFQQVQVSMIPTFFLNFSEFDFYLKNPLIEPWLFCDVFSKLNFPEFQLFS